MRIIGDSAFLFRPTPLKAPAAGRQGAAQASEALQRQWRESGA